MKKYAVFVAAFFIFTANPTYAQDDETPFDEDLLIEGSVGPFYAQDGAHLDGNFFLEGSESTYLHDDEAIFNENFPIESADDHYYEQKEAPWYKNFFIARDDGYPWYDNFFIEGSAIYYFAPAILNELVKPKVGFRGALGYEFKRFRFAVEAGQTGIEGTNPLVLDIVLVPLLFKFGYALPIRYGLGVQADISTGVFFSSVTRYETVLDLLMENLLHDKKTSFFSGVRLYLTYSPWKFLKIYAGGGTDIIFEDDGPIALPLIEAGISLKPLAIKITLPKKELFGVYFEQNSTVLPEEFFQLLDEVGQKMADNEKLFLTLKAYYAPGGIEWQVRRINREPALSAARASIIADYLEEKYGINLERIKLKHAAAGRRENFYRFVEINVYSKLEIKLPK